jgi:hypothetical protein
MLAVKADTDAEPVVVVRGEERAWRDCWRTGQRRIVAVIGEEADDDEAK